VNTAIAAGKLVLSSHKRCSEIFTILTKKKKLLYHTKFLNMFKKWWRQLQWWCVCYKMMLYQMKSLYNGKWKDDYVQW